MTMSETAIAANLNQALDIEINLFSKFTLNPILLVYNLPETVDFFLSKVIYLRVRRDLSLSQNPVA